MMGVADSLLIGPYPRLGRKMPIITCEVPTRQAALCALVQRLKVEAIACLVGCGIFLGALLNYLRSGDSNEKADLEDSV